MATWSLDSCPCIIEVDSNFNFVSFINRCPDHNNTSFGDIRNENIRGPSNTMWEILQNAPSGAVDTLPDGSKQFKGGINASWSWSGTAPNRLLTITITGITLTAQQKSAIKNKLDTRFGIDNVVILNVN